MAEGTIKYRDSNADENELFQASDAPVKCNFCSKTPSKYTCPRCNAPYCSVDCYRGEKHLSCSELFYKDCVLTSLKDERANDEDKRKVKDMLKRLEDEFPLENEEEAEEEEEEEVESLEERLGDINVDDADPELVWSKLNEKEKREFEEIIRNGAIGDLIELWTAWWEVEDKSGKIEVIHKEEEEGEVKKSSIPHSLKKIPTLSSLASGKPSSPYIKFHTVDILYSYAYILRLFNGCHYEMISDVSLCILKVSSVLSRNEVLDSVKSVLYSCMHNVQQHEDIKNSAEFGCKIIKDVVAIITGHQLGKKNDQFVISALSDLYHILSSGRNELKACKENEKIGKIKEMQKALQMAKKKVYFMTAWVKENYIELMSLIPFLELEHAKLTVQYEQHEKEKNKLEEVWGGTKPQKKKTLIEEC